MCECVWTLDTTGRGLGASLWERVSLCDQGFWKSNPGQHGPGHNHVPWAQESAPARRHRGGASAAGSRGRRCFRPARIGRRGTAGAGGVSGAHGVAARMRRSGRRRGSRSGSRRRRRRTALLAASGQRQLSRSIAVQARVQQARERAVGGCRPGLPSSSRGHVGRSPGRQVASRSAARSSQEQPGAQCRRVSGRACEGLRRPARRA